MFTIQIPTVPQLFARFYRQFVCKIFGGYIKVLKQFLIQYITFFSNSEIFPFQGMTALLTKIEFLDNVSEFFPHYFDETFEATLLKNNGFLLNDDEQSTKVVFKYRQSEVLTRGSSSWRIPKLCNLSRVEAKS